MSVQLSNYPAGTGPHDYESWGVPFDDRQYCDKPDCAEYRLKGGEGGWCLAHEIEGWQVGLAQFIAEEMPEDVALAKSEIARLQPMQRVQA